jgi:hypothetical protein
MRALGHSLIVGFCFFLVPLLHAGDNETPPRTASMKVTFVTGNTITFEKVVAVVREQGTPGDMLQSPQLDPLPGPRFVMSEGGSLVVPWEKIKEIKVEGGDKRKTGESNVTIILASGNSQELKKVYLDSSSCTFIGKSELGESTFKLKDVTQITVLTSGASRNRPRDTGPATPGEKPQSRASPSSLRQLLPVSSDLQGENRVVVENPNDFSVWVALRSGGKGIDFDVGPYEDRNVYITDGPCEAYFVYPGKPTAVFQGPRFTCSGEGKDIQIARVVDGNYRTRQVK